jgi:hypothetical protein
MRKQKAVLRATGLASIFFSFVSEYTLFMRTTLIFSINAAMSDDDFMVESNDEYDFDYSENEDDSEAQTDFENRYYNAKQLKDVNSEKAVEAFVAITEAESSSSEWFRCIKSDIKWN